MSFFSYDHISTTVLTPWSQEQVQVLPLPTSARTNTALFLYWCSSKTSWISACAPFGTAYNSCQLSHFTLHYLTLHYITLHLYPNGTRSSTLKETCCILKNVYQNTNVNTVFTNLNIKFKVCKSMHHHTIQITQPTRCNNFSSLLPDVYVQLNMFRASSRPSSGAQQLQ